MNRKSQFIPTGRYDRWRLLRRCAWLVPLVNAVKCWLMVGPAFRDAVASAPDPGLGLLAASAVFLLEVLLGSFPLFFLWWCVCTMLMSRARREATFVPSRDLTYYRELLKGLSAVQVSLLADLRVEPREDAAATLLSLEQRGIVSLEGEQVHVLDGGTPRDLSRSERLLLQYAADGDLGASAYAQWASVAEEEAIDGIHLRRIGTPDAAAQAGCASFARGCGSGCLVIIVLCALFGLFAVTVGREFMEVLDTAETDYEMVGMMIENPALAAELLFMVAVALVMIVAFLLPLVDTVRGLVENGDASRYLQRTPLGEQEAECVYGIRNYVRDFTSLSEADRHELLLWDDFLVYAVALGQNPHVVAQLTSIWREHRTES